MRKNHKNSNNTIIRSSQDPIYSDEPTCVDDEENYDESLYIEMFPTDANDTQCRMCGKVCV